MHTTPASLLERLHQSQNQAAWETFVRLYQPLLGHWARKLGLQGPDADDLVQEVFAILVRQLPAFRYDPRKRFRAWLWTVTVNKARERRRQSAGAPPETNQALDQVSGPDEDEAAEAEYRDYLLRRALEILRPEFTESTWKAFWECAMAGRPAAEVAAELDLSLNAVYTAKSRVLRRLRRELEGLLD
jgi:RNA polymerase sigma-70 factor (ECF subfamily)